MSADARKNLRTQGRYSGGSKNQRPKTSPGARDSSERKNPQRYSNGNKSTNNSWTDESSSPFKYEANFNYSFDQLENARAPQEIKEAGVHILSTTDNGESKVYYDPKFLLSDEGNDYYDDLYNNITWHMNNILIHGVEYPQPRLVAWFGPHQYSYSGSTMEPAEMPPTVVEIKERIEDNLRHNGIDVTFNSVLINLYRDGRDSVNWHSDDEFSLGIQPTIASVSLGETRRFEMRRKKKWPGDNSSYLDLRYFMHLIHGSLLVMTGCMQDDWQHRIPKEYHDKEGRINLTFRTVYSKEEAPRRLPAPVTTFPAIIGDPNVGSSSGAAPVHQYKYNEDFPLLNNKANSAVSISTDWSSVPPRTNANSAAQQNVSNKNFGNSVADKSNSGALGDNNEEEAGDWSSASFESPEHSNQHNNQENFNKKESPKKFNDKAHSSDGREHTFQDVRSWRSDNARQKNWRIPDRSNNPRPWQRDSFPRNQRYSFSKQQCERISDEAPKQWENSSDIHGNWLNDSDDENNLNKNDTPKPRPSPDEIKTPKTQLNVQAEEFVPAKYSNHFNRNSDSNPFGMFDLKEFVNYEVDLMLGKKLQDFSFGLKEKVIERIDDFSANDRKDVKLLVQLTDGSQTDRNQILISSRLCEIVKDAFYSQSPTSDISASCGRNTGLLPSGRN